MSAVGPLTMALDRRDRIVAGDPALLEINARAGGVVGEVPAMPDLAVLARLSRRLGIAIARSVTLGDGELDMDCRIEAAPSDDGVRLALSIVRERAAWRSLVPAFPEPPPPPGADWTWEVDAELRLRRFDAHRDIAADIGPGAMLTRLFTLEAGEGGSMPLVEAMAGCADFDGQRATLATGGRVTIAGLVRRDPLGAFAGFAGGTFHGDERVAEDALEIGQRFNARLERVLRAPLGRIVAHADSINAAAEGPLDPHYVDYAADIASAGRHLLGLVDDLADLEAIERDDFRIEAEPIDVADVMRRATGLLSVRAADAGVTIDRGPPSPARWAHGEFRRLLQIMVNLLGNAIRYSPQGGTVWLRLHRDGDRIVAIVADQGRGIDVADQERVFGKFERLDTSEPGGTGLGLYIARRLARAMGGDLAVDSAPGAGARFILSLPAAEA